MFSSRLPPSLEPNPLARAVARMRAERASFIDLTESNPTRAGFEYPRDLLAPLADPGSLDYDPHPLGLWAAREAVACEYRRRGSEIDPERVALTAGTSDAYSLLFKLLCDPGDAVIVPRPGYPLFEHLTRLDGVSFSPYDLEYHGRWSIDVASIARAISSRTRAVLVVSPNNPTGSFVSAAELDEISDLCARHGVALVGDEVFADYVLDSQAPRATSVVVQRRALAFGLGGLSKSAGLPQVKLGWIAAGGPEDLARHAMERLELVCDTYLSVGTPVQRAAARLISAGAAIRHQIAGRIARNWQDLQSVAAQRPACRLLHAEGGWYGILQVPATAGEEAMVLELLEADRVLVHPGYFFDFPREAYLVVSLLPEPDLFHRGVERVLERVATG